MSESDRELIDLDLRHVLATKLQSAGMVDQDYELKPDLSTLPVEAQKTKELNIQHPEALAPQPQPIDPAPQPSGPLPSADVVVMTWTVAECDALADVFTPGYTRHQ